MVAITVILAAVIGTFVLQLGGQVQQNVQAGASVSFDTSDDELSVEYTSNQNADFLNVSVTTNGTTYYELNNVGNKITIKKNSTAGDGYNINATTDSTQDVTATGAVTFTKGTNSGDALNAWYEWADGTDVSVTVTAIKGDTSTVIVSKSDTL